MWGALIEPLPGPSWFGSGAKVAYVRRRRGRSAAAILGNALIWIGTPLYPFYRAGEHLSGISPLADQQIGGAIMFVWGAVATVTLFAWFFLRWAREAELRQQLLEGGASPRVAARAARYGRRPVDPAPPPPSALSARHKRQASEADQHRQDPDRDPVEVDLPGVADPERDQHPVGGAGHEDQHHPGEEAGADRGPHRRVARAVEDVVGAAALEAALEEGPAEQRRHHHRRGRGCRPRTGSGSRSCCRSRRRSAASAAGRRSASRGTSRAGRRWFPGRRGRGPRARSG